MSLLFPILAAILQASSFTLDKAILNLRRVGFVSYTGASFPLVFLITGVIFFIFKPPFTVDLFGGYRFALILLSVGGSAVSNILYYRALKSDTLQELQSLELISVIPIILFSSVLFSDERNLFVILPAAVASLAVIWSHWEHKRFVIAKKTLPFIVWSLAIAPFSAPVSKTLLIVWDPVSLELVRSAGMALLFLPFTRRALSILSARAWGLIVVTNVFTSVAWILFFVSFQRSGIVYTLLIFSLQPILVYLASMFILKEKVHWKKMTAFAVILCSIAFAQYMA